MPARGSRASNLSSALDSKEDLTHLLILRFQQMLSEGVLKPGTKLPPERELAAYFKVARSSLRQALKVLEMMGVITQRIGDGSYLNQDASSVLAVPMEFLFLLDGISVEELTEVRILIEPALAAKAAERANANHIASLRQSVQDLENSKHDRIKLISADLLFHKVIFEASGNRLMGRMFHTIHRAMLDMMMLTSQVVDLEHTVAFHKPILEAIQRRDAALASKLMSDHMTDAARLLDQIRKKEKERALRQHMASTNSSVRKRSGGSLTGSAPLLPNERSRYAPKR